MAATLTKLELIERLYDAFGLNKTEARNLIDLFFTEIAKALAVGNSVKISKFGNFTLRDKRARPGRNPKSGKKYIISARRVVTFRSGIKLRGKLDQYEGTNSETKGKKK